MIPSNSARSLLRFFVRRRRIAAAELLAKVNADPEYVAARKREDEERQRRDAAHRLAEAPLVEELRAADCQVHSV